MATERRTEKRGPLHPDFVDIPHGTDESEASPPSRMLDSAGRHTREEDSEYMPYEAALEAHEREEDAREGGEEKPAQTRGGASSEGPEMTRAGFRGEPDTPLETPPRKRR
jgi:hypothetical protein